MKAHWKITLTLLTPLLFIFTGIYLKLTLDAKYAESDYMAYYMTVARPAIDTLNEGCPKANAAENQNKLSAADRMNAMSVMLKHAENQRKHREAIARNRVVGYALLGAYALAALFLGVGLFRQEEKEK